MTVNIPSLEQTAKKKKINKKKTLESVRLDHTGPLVVLLLQMYSDRLKEHVLVKDLWTSEAPGGWTEISKVPENLLRLMIWKNSPPSVISAQLDHNRRSSFLTLYWYPGVKRGTSSCRLSLRLLRM